jgi:hypothetical protein
MTVSKVVNERSTSVVKLSTKVVVYVEDTTTVIVWASGELKTVEVDGSMP